ncbi:hypothetical protein TNIN_359501 [Trichonephila inaurata madagascariensis]|uniref:Uncharacterized protein n=1 Tax=Trichonephila inaurata madagascariensis TaxID=2747483 RepID=A0A8X6YG05_9ARAC|nr:hypothetical protein TNIN_359501 [Trichonephila inaurata madagascariensis]
MMHVQNVEEGRKAADWCAQDYSSTNHDSKKKEVHQWMDDEDRNGYSSLSTNENIVVPLDFNLLLTLKFAILEHNF